MGRDESGTLAALKAHLRELIDPKIAEYGGRTVKSMGDGLLLGFPSVVDAVRCAVDVQRGMVERNADVPDDRQIRFRVGINVGDIIIDGDDIFGDGVNVAARLQALAEPGGICVSRGVRDQVLDKLSFTFEDLGAQEVKNIVRPVEVYRVALDGSESPSGRGRIGAKETRRRWWPIAAGVAGLALVVGGALMVPRWPAPSPPEVPPLSLAVLPFVAGGDPADRAFADSLTADVATGIERTAHSFRIVSPAAALAYRGEPTNPGDAARALRARYLASGEVRRVGDQGFVAIHLVDRVQDRQVWSDRIKFAATTPATDVQRQLASQLAHRLRIAVIDAEVKRLRSEPSPRGNALELVLRADGVWDANPDLVQGAREARKLYDEALKIDPNSVPALLGRGFTLNTELGIDPAADRDRLPPLLEDTANRAFALDQDDASVWLLRARMLAWQWRWEAALAAFERAERLDPNRAGLVTEHAYLLMWMGRPADAIAVAGRATELDVNQSYSGPILRMRCRCNIMLDRIEDAIAECEKSIAGEDIWASHLYLVAAYALRGDATRAEAEKSVLLKRWPEASVAKFIAVGKRYTNEPAFWDSSERTVLAGLRKAGLPER